MSRKKQKYEDRWQVFEVKLQKANALERNQFSKELLLLFKKKWRRDTVRLPSGYSFQI
jgi:hypothetical protein